MSRWPRATISIPVDDRPVYRGLAVTNYSLTFFCVDGEWKCEFAFAEGSPTSGRAKGISGASSEMALDGSDWPPFLLDAVRGWHESVLAVVATVT